MKINDYDSNQSLIAEISRRIKDYRISLNITQEEMALRTGLSKKTISNMENGRDFSFDSFVRILKEFDLIDGLNELIPEQNTIQIARRGVRIRQRAREKTNAVSPWKWGDEK